MYPDHDRNHASVPVGITNVTIIWCNHCQAWRVTWQKFTQSGDESMSGVESGEQEFGPFDTMSTVREFAMVRLFELFSAGSVPG